MNEEELGRLLATNKPQPGISDLPKFLTTSAGKQAVRGAIDNIIARQKIMGIPATPINKDLIQALISQVPSVQAPDSFMQDMPSSYSQMGSIPSGPTETPELRDSGQMPGLSGQGMY